MQSVVPLFLEQAAQPMLVLHGLLAGAVVGLLIHHAVWVLGSRWQTPHRRRQARTFLRLGALLTSLELLLGLLIYPVYRVRVREAFFEVRYGITAPLKTYASLFDLKEHTGSMLVAVVLALLLVDRGLEAWTRNRVPHEARALHVGLSVLAAGLAIFVATAGLWVTTIRGLPVQVPGVPLPGGHP